RPSVTDKVRKLTAGFVFVGYGLKDRRYGFDDYRGLDVKGKIVVALDGAPAGLPSDVSAHLNASKDQIAAEQGAIGFVELRRNNGSPGRGDPVRRAGRPLIDWVDTNGKAGSTPPGLKLELGLSQEIAARLFEGAPKTLDAVRSQAKDKSKGGPRGFALAPVLAVESASQCEGFT